MHFLLFYSNIDELLTLATTYKREMIAQYVRRDQKGGIVDMEARLSVLNSASHVTKDGGCAITAPLWLHASTILTKPSTVVLALEE